MSHQCMSRLLRRSKHCAPVAPDKPVDPVRPLRPVSPMAPVRPDDPVRPLRPVCPELPARQPSRCEAECCHCRRVCCIESKSSCPSYACQDSWGEASPSPVAPDKPVDPVRPLRPVSPVAPVRPDDPVRPLRPVCPELPARQPSTCEADCCHCRRICCIESKNLGPIYACQDC